MEALHTKKMIVVDGWYSQVVDCETLEVREAAP